MRPLHPVVAAMLLMAVTWCVAAEDPAPPNTQRELPVNGDPALLKERERLFIEANRLFEMRKDAEAPWCASMMR